MEYNGFTYKVKCGILKRFHGIGTLLDSNLLLPLERHLCFVAMHVKIFKNVGRCNFWQVIRKIHVIFLLSDASPGRQESGRMLTQNMFLAKF